MFKKATRQQARLRLGLVGPAGGGKTYTALRVAMGLSGKVALIDTEHGSASKYVGEVEDGVPFEFDSIDLGKERGKFSVENYLRAIKAAGEAGYDVLVIDSLSHAWAGPGGVLEFVDAAASRARGNSYAGWREGTPLHNSLIEAILASPCHVIATMRSKTEYVLEKDERTGKQVPRKIGMQPVQRDGMDFEFDVVGDLEQDTHKLIITKTRCPALDGVTLHKPGADLARTLREWLGRGEIEAPPAAAVEEKDPSWRDDQRRFFGRLGEFGAEYEAVKALCASLKRPKPSAMTQEARDALVEWLKTPAGAAKLATFTKPADAAAPEST